MGTISARKRKDDSVAFMARVTEERDILRKVSHWSAVGSSPMGTVFVRAHQAEFGVPAMWPGAAGLLQRPLSMA